MKTWYKTPLTTKLKEAATFLTAVASAEKESLKVEVDMFVPRCNGLRCGSIVETEDGKCGIFSQPPTSTRAE